MPDNEEPNVQKPMIDPARAIQASYPGNSKKSKAEKPKEKPKVEKVIEGTAIKQKPPLGKRIRQAFTGDDARSVMDYLIFEVALPALKTTISDMVSQGAERMLFGESSRVRGPGNRRPGRVDYNVISRNGSGVHVVNESTPRMSSRDRATHNFDNIVIPTRPEAETVLQSMMDLIDQFNMATVSDLYDLVGITGSFADDKWGWFDLRGADIVRVRDGFVLDLPATQPIS